VQTGKLDQEALERWGGADALVHLAGENIAAHRWTKEQKRKIRESRVDATERLIETLLPLKLKVFIGASAVGFYGDRADEILTESSAPGTGFLAETSVAWEAAAKPLAEAGLRMVHLRFGLILSGRGGALRKMAPVFRVGLGGRLGSGKQWVSWISIHDVVRVIEFCLNEEAAVGAFNVVAPEPVRNAEFTKALAQAVHRPAVLPVPAFALRLFVGELADAALLNSQRVVPQRLLKLGFRFELPDLSAALGVALKEYKN
jgi:uncharacterized protein (TIGR01777 family)